MPRFVPSALLVVLAVSGCPGTGGPGTPDAGVAVDAARPRDAGRDAAVTCAAGTHLCGGGCIPDLADDPAAGCRFGCGEPCPAPERATATCARDGRCDFTCASPFRRVGDACTCTPSTCEALGFVECGEPDDGCGTPLDCGTCAMGGACVAGRCGCPPDAHEENDSASTATRIAGDLNDADDPDTSVSDFNLHSARDEDWIRWHVVDGFDLGGNPIITVSLADAPIGADYDLAAYYECDSGGDATTCDLGTADASVGPGCRSATVGSSVERVTLSTECSGIDEHGTLYVRVRSTIFAGCGGYRVLVSVR